MPAEQTRLNSIQIQLYFTESAIAECNFDDCVVIFCADPDLHIIPNLLLVHLVLHSLIGLHSQLTENIQQRHRLAMV